MPLLREKTKTYTAEDYWNLPEDCHAELIDGSLYDMVSPSPFHQELVMEISATIRQYIKDHDGKCKVYPAPLAVNLRADDSTWVEPDISVVCDKNKITVPSHTFDSFIIKISDLV
ncbi:MAG: Uma2 family endonuclease [Coprococcus sp.]|nr:Uma2 family endonuclease [Coprococcus sp.]